jgi:cardiolipin synthase
MYADCVAAHESIDIEQYIFGMDKIGARFAEMLKRKSREGVKIRMICDAVGSFDLLNSVTERSLSVGGIEIKFFNPIQPWRIGNFSSWFRRDHRKILVVDRKVAHTGGVGLEDRMKDWRDTNVRMTGSVVTEMQSAFNQAWIAVSRRKFFKFKPVFLAGEDFSFLVNSPRFRRRYIYHDLRRTIRKAKEYIYLTTPYFVPSVKIFRSLTKAARRGVDVRILVPEHSDVHVTDIAAGSYFLLALRAGIKIYQYGGGRILHAKTGVIDDVWGSVGSANIDNLSLLLNLEGNIKSLDQDFIAELKRQFLDDITNARIVEKEDWIRRPFLLKFFEVIIWPIHNIL